MINVTTDARLSIFLPNTNKALAEAIKIATPEQLTQLKEGKDIKSLLASVFQDKISMSKSDQTLLDILKNGAAFKNMGNFTENLKSLLSELKATPTLAQKVETIERFFKPITSMDTASLKSQISNSGVFMESKIASAVQILPTLKETLTSLQNLLSKSTLPEANALSSKIGSFLESGSLNQFPQEIKGAVAIIDTLKQLSDSLKSIVSKSDVLYSKEITQFAQKIDQLASTTPQAAVSEIKTTLSQLYGALLSSKADGVNPLLDSIELLLKNINNTTKDPIVPLKELSNQLHEAIASGDVVVSHETSMLITKLGEFTHPESLQLDHTLQESMGDDLKSGLMKLSEELQNSADPSAKMLLEHVDKLLTQIDYQQLVSHLNHSNSIYIPFVWDQLDEGSMTFKKNNNKFYCEINLRLKEYGELDLMMGLYEGNQIEIQAHTQKPQLKELIQENLGQLRTLLINAGLTPRSIRVYETKESPQHISDSYGSQDFGSDLGFEVKV